MFTAAMLVIFAAICGVQAMRAVRLLHAALWLAGLSVAVTLMLYSVGAATMAVIELSLSVGLITILLVFAISLVGADSPDQPVSRPLNIPLVLAMLLLIVGLTVPLLGEQGGGIEESFSTIFWQQREADVIAQIALIFAGVLGVLALLTEAGQRQASQQQIEEQVQPETPEDALMSEEQPELEKV
ncbi:MAG: NADH-quinone oxidoreductase subunit J [Anaerolineae bacterium]|nr:NADH-quinone oxidoreductase subunit J [Anaerolineae bacterium]